MEIFTELKTYKNINLYNTNGLIFCYEKYYTYTSKTFNIDKIKLIVSYCHKNNIKSIIRVDKIIEEKELDEFLLFLDLMIKLNVDYFMFSDMAVYNHLNKYNLLYKLIYTAHTLICNFEDVLFFKEKNIKVMLSNELPQDDIIKNSSLGNAMILVYGYNEIFYTKRKLISIFNEHDKINSSSKKLLIEEELRKERYPLIENQNGAFVLTNYKQVIFKEIELISKDIILYINSYDIKENDLFNIINIYNDLLICGYTDELYNKLKDIDDNIHHQFMYLKPLILKEDK